MDQHDASQRQYATNPYASQQSQHNQSQIPTQYDASSISDDRFAPAAYLQQAPATPTQAARAERDPQHLYALQRGAQFGAIPAMQSGAQYLHTIPTPEAQRSTPHSAYSSYDGSLAYGVAQPPLQSQPTAQLYEQMPQYRPRVSGSAGTLSSPFGVAQATQYYHGGQSAPAAAPVAALASQQVPSPYQQTSYPQPGPSIPHTYHSAMFDPTSTSTTTYASYASQSAYGTQQAARNVDEEIQTIRARLRGIFAMVRDGTLHDIDQQLLQVSQHLLGNVDNFGLSRDDEDRSVHDERIRLWDEFNHAWLATLQRQYDMMQGVIRTNQPLREPQSVMTTPVLEQLSRELVRLCDIIEPKGLVDYQMGVAEEEIMDLMLRCLAQLEPVPTDPSGEEIQPELSSSFLGGRSSR